MTRTIENVLTRSALHDDAGIHDSNLLCDICHNTEIMCDHDDGCLIFLLQILNNIENLSLNCHIECGRWLVTDQNFRLTGKCNRDHNTLTHTAGKFVRILSDTFFRLRDADHAQHLDSLLCRFLFCHVFVAHQIFHNLFSDTHRRI